MGLGLGANHIIPTIIASFVLLGFLTIFNFAWKKRIKYIKTSYIFLTFKEKVELEELNKILSQETKSADLRRFDVDSNQTIANYIVDFATMSCIDNLIKKIKSTFPSASISFFDHRDSPKI